MQLSRLSITHLRNLRDTTLHLHPSLNVFFGINGSGKTSVLEAIALLLSGKSFRTARQEESIQFCKTSYVISGIVGTSVRMGVERTRGGKQKIRLNDCSVDKIVELTQLLPMQLLNIDTYRLLEEGPLMRRQFMDWGVFYVEPVFFKFWQRYNRALQQRNAALKAMKGRKITEYCADIHMWEQELCEVAHYIDELRSQYIKAWTPVFEYMLKSMLDIQHLVVEYKRGWSQHTPLKEALKETLMRDVLLGYTTLGPHKADLSFFINDVPAKSVLSRGQLKLFVCALLLARAEALVKKTGKQCLFMIDDLNSELDIGAAQILVDRLTDLGSQLIITGIEKKPLIGLLRDKTYQLFHVEHGAITAMLDW